MIEADLRTFLLGQPAISDLIGARLYPLRLPQGVTFPAVTYQRIAGAGLITHDGAAGLASARVQIDCWSDQTYESALTLAGAVRAALSGYRGGMGASVVAAVTVVNDLDVPEPEPALWRRMIEITFWHEVAA